MKVYSFNKGSVLIQFVIVIIVILLIVGIGYVVFHFPKNSGVQTVPLSAQPQVTDLDPGLPASQKTTLVIRNTDSSTTAYLIPTSQVSDYIKHLPQGLVVVSKSP